MFQNSLQMFAQSEFWQNYDLCGHFKATYEGILGLILKNVLGRSLFDSVVLVLIIIHPAYSQLLQMQADP